MRRFTLGRQVERQRRIVHHALVRFPVEFARLVLLHRVRQHADEPAAFRLEVHAAVFVRLLLDRILIADDDRHFRVRQRLAVPQHGEFNLVAFHVRHDLQLQLLRRAGRVHLVRRRPAHVLGVIH